ncbi:MAG: hypothetical protein L0210_03535, partial [Rhodospirillales bacterium]|nr:hypothetical protein [Rhodospirillales bacterium]
MTWTGGPGSGGAGHDSYYYQLEEEMLRAALGAVTPQKPGPKKPLIDPVKETMEQKLKETEREKELLQIKLKH